jgi:outer membrane protein
MKMTMRFIITFSILLFFELGVMKGQDSTWTLQACIDYALRENIQVQKSELTNNSNLVYEKQARAERLPSLNASIGQNFYWKKSDTATTEYNSSNGTLYSVNSSMPLYNSFKINNKIKQSQINFESGRYNLQATKESISLSILNAYLQLLYAEELVKTNQVQLESTGEQLKLADQRMSIGIIAKSDLLQVKSQYATENYNLANAKGQLITDRLNLMQIMQYPVSDSFKVFHPNLDSLMVLQKTPDKDTVYKTALAIKPQIKSAALNKESALLSEKIARADYWPKLTLDASLGTNYTSLNKSNYTNQVNQYLQPFFGLSLGIPIYENRQVKSNVEIAKIGIANAELDELNTKTILRQNIEQASADVTTAQIKYDASLEQYNAADESYLLASEKFSNGLINSVDFIIQKTNLNLAESQLLQAKYNLIFSYKILDFYSGIPLAF